MGYAIYKFNNYQSANNLQISKTETKTEYVERCGSECQQAIESAINNLTISQPLVGSTVTPAVKARAVPTKTKTRTVSYVTVPGSGSTTKNDWADISGTEFYFDTKDYPGLAEIYFEANMKLFNGNGRADVRLFDATHEVGVQGSEVATSAQSDAVVVSGKVTFWSGKNTIRVQAKSLTADTAIFNSGRLRVVVEN